MYTFAEVDTFTNDVVLAVFNGLNDALAFVFFFQFEFNQITYCERVGTLNTCHTKFPLDSTIKEFAVFQISDLVPATRTF